MEKFFTVTLGDKASEIYYGDSLASFWGSLEALEGQKLFVCDTNTVKFIPEKRAKVVIASGEAFKNWQSVAQILEQARELNFGRDDYLIACGGGVIGDITAFAASLYMRGCRLILVPTTLLAMVDATLGGKTAIDFAGSKNLVGTFYPANQVYLWPQFLETLSPREYKNGLAEVLKHALIAQDEELLHFLEQNREALLSRQPKVFRELLYISLLVKKSFIERDPFETKGIREALNFGHTFAHALEVLGNFKRYSHGEAVAWGMAKALKAGVELGLTKREFAQMAQALLVSYTFSSDYKVDDKEAFLKALQSDKKRRKGDIRFVLLKERGSYLMRPLPTELIRAVIE
ncbi:MAG: 3-dehydroquinate synthase family protein [Sphaerochaetaceae bacterium]